MYQMRYTCANKMNAWRNRLALQKPYIEWSHFSNGEKERGEAPNLASAFSTMYVVYPVLNSTPYTVHYGGTTIGNTTYL